MRCPTPILLLRALLPGVVMLPLYAGGQAITYVDLHPPGATQSVAYATTEHQQAGQVDGRAAIWAGTPTTITLLGGPGSSALDTTGTRQVGYYHFALHHGIFTEGGSWFGTSNSWTPLPHADPGLGYRTGPVAIDGDWLVGGDFGYRGSALLWNLAAGTVVDLSPPLSANAAAIDICGGQQVGYLFNHGLGLQAALWTGTAESYVSLHPPGASYSRANATSGLLQGGAVRLGAQNHAALWLGTAESMVDVHPTGATSSVIYGAVGEWQSGTASFGAHTHAGLWRGTAESFVNLHSALAAGEYSRSDAHRMWTDGRTLKIAGRAVVAATGLPHAMLWIVTLPDNNAPVITDAVANPGVLWPPNRMMRPVRVDALVTDDSGAAHWRVTQIECNEAAAPGDMQILNDYAVLLRATRAGRVAGRIYTLWLQAEDAAGNVSQSYRVCVTVPHDHRTKSKSSTNQTL